MQSVTPRAAAQPYWPGEHAASPERETVTRFSPAQVIGEVFLTVGAILLLFAFYESFWTNIASGQMQDEAQSRLEEVWEENWVNPRAAKAPAEGDAFARMYIPVFGPDYRFAIIEGVDPDALLVGPGRYPDTQMPGEPGNFAVAGHRVGKGAPFNDLGQLTACDAIVVETQTQWVTYRVLPMEADPELRRLSTSPCLPDPLNERIATGDYAGVLGRRITLPGDIDVVNPMPDSRSIEVEPGMESIITLTTCHPQFSNAERMIIHAVKTEALPKSPDGGGALPAAMTERS